VPWGNTREEREGYHLVWPRDLCRIATALLDAGDPDAALELLARADTVYAATLPHDHPRRLDLLATVRRLRA